MSPSKKTFRKEKIKKPERPRVRNGDFPSIVDLKIEKAKLINFFESKTPKGHAQRFLVLVYYLKNNLDLFEVGIDEIFTCYRILGIKGPKFWLQVFRDVKSKLGWFNHGNEVGRYALTNVGEEFVIYDMPKKRK